MKTFRVLIFSLSLVLLLGAGASLIWNSRAMADHPVTAIILAELLLDLQAACEDASGGTELVMFRGLSYNLVTGDGDHLYGKDIRATKNRDILYGETAVELSGRKGSDILCGNSGPNILNGGSGDDYALGGDGEDQLHGGGGNDTLFGGEKDDILNGGGNDDILVGGPGNDELWGGVKSSPAALWPWLSPFMRGGSGDDHLYGGEGDDLLKGGSGDDVLIGGNDPEDPDNSEYDDLHGGNHNDDLYGGLNATFDGGWHSDYCNQDGDVITNGFSCEKNTPNQ